MLDTVEPTQTSAPTKAEQLDASRLPHGEENLTPLAQLRRMQRVLYSMTQEEGIDKKEAAVVACAWERLEGRKAILTMRPAPKPIDVSDKRKPQRRRVQVAIEHVPQALPSPITIPPPGDNVS